MNFTPQKKTPWRFAGKSDIGRVRQVNEDAFCCDRARGGFLAVADGVGGLEFGERASGLAVAELEKNFSKKPVPAETPPDFVEIFRDLDAKIDALGEKLVPGFGIATTLDVAADGGNGVIHFAHLGDSGIFLLRGNALAQLSREQTLAAEELARGNSDFPENYVSTLTHALGVGVCCEPQIFSVETRAGDRILMATDGITRTLDFEKIAEILGDPAGTPESVCDALIREANAAGGFDNATAVVAFL